MAATPRQRLAAVCALSGQDAVVSACLDLLHGRPADPDVVLALGGPAARAQLAGGSGIGDHWLRIWAARGLLWARVRNAAERAVVRATEGRRPDRSVRTPAG